ncbi:chromate efflux transporter [Thalassolituus sp. LLYu03]|uniref:chromate efflux transporter n=1 Tax=Thalassolituus sp. LLYu03 TaxID=3421656 RepID=UPI003D2B7711
MARFEQTFVRRLGWLGAGEFQQRLAQAHLLPGPSSSQLGFAIGHHRAGLTGALLAFVAFTLPSVLLMLLAALHLHRLPTDWLGLLTHGFKLVAVVVIADAVLSMARSFCRTSRGVGWALLALAASVAGFSVAVIGLLVLLVLMAEWILRRLLRKPLQTPFSVPASPAPAEFIPGSRVLYRSGFWLVVWALFLAASFYSAGALWSGFYQVGTSVFGGGHVVLPLMQQAFSGQLNANLLFNGYAAAQAVPGPMFTLATYIGASSVPQAPVSAALIATAAVFLPGFLLMLAFMPVWQWLQGIRPVASAVAALSAAMVGVLAAAGLVVLEAALLSVSDVVLIGAGLVLLLWKRIHILLLMAFMLATVAVRYWWL